MAKFTTRVELYGAPDGEVYEKLHVAMKRQGFTRTIESGELTYQLPSAEYTRTSDLSIEQVRDAAVAAAESVWSDCAVLVTKADGPRVWHRLRKV